MQGLREIGPPFRAPRFESWLLHFRPWFSGLGRSDRKNAVDSRSPPAREVSQGPQSVQSRCRIIDDAEVTPRVRIDLPCLAAGAHAGENLGDEYRGIGRRRLA